MISLTYNPGASHRSWATAYSIEVPGLGSLSITLDSDGFSLSELTPCCGQEMVNLPRADESGPFTGPFASMRPDGQALRLRCACNYYAPYRRSFELARGTEWLDAAPALQAWLESWAEDFFHLNGLESVVALADLPPFLRTLAYPMEMWPAHDGVEAQAHIARMVRSQASPGTHMSILR